MEKTNKNKLQTVIVDCRRQFSIGDISSLINRASSSSNHFFLVKNHYDAKGFIKVNVFDYLTDLIDTGLKYVNIIVVPQPTNNNPLDNNVLYLIWMVKSYSEMRFDKDCIREKHIWKDVEWGKREKNYNSKGKDPGNFWLPTEDDGKGKITFHNILTIEGVFARIIDSTCIENDHVEIFSDEEFDKIESKIIRNVKIEFSKISPSAKKSIDVTIKEEHNKFNVKKSKEKSKIFFSSSENMSEIKDESVDLMVTSPPYWDLKNYFKEGQIGQESYEEYLERMNSVWRETYRVLRPNASMWININTRSKNKKPILIPNDIIKQCKLLGFHLRDIIIWHKSSGIPTHKNNLVDRYEFFLWFTRTSNYFLNTQKALRLNDYKNEKLASGLTWNVNRKAGSVGKDFVHPAIYPTDLISRIIEICTQDNSVILDPFMGSGTTMIAAKKSNRTCIGYEFNEGFEALIKYRLKNEIEDSKFVEFHYSKEMKDSIFRKNM